MRARTGLEPFEGLSSWKVRCFGELIGDSAEPIAQRPEVRALGADVWNGHVPIHFTRVESSRRRRMRRRPVTASWPAELKWMIASRRPASAHEERNEFCADVAVTHATPYRSLRG